MIYIQSPECISITSLTTLMIYLSLMIVHLLEGFHLPHLQMQAGVANKISVRTEDLELTTEK